MSNRNGDHRGFSNIAKRSLQQKVEAATTIREMAEVYTREIKNDLNLLNDYFRHGRAYGGDHEETSSRRMFSSALEDQKEERFNYQSLAQEGLATLAWIEQRALEHVMDGRIPSGEFNDVEHFLKDERAHLYRRMGIIESRMASGIHNEPVIGTPRTRR